MKIKRQNYPNSPISGLPSTFNLPVEEFIDQTIQNDVPTLKEIISRYRLTGEVIGSQNNIIYSDENTVDINGLLPDIEDLNAQYQKAQTALTSETFSKKNLKKEVQLPPEGDKEGE